MKDILETLGALFIVACIFVAGSVFGACVWHGVWQQVTVHTGRAEWVVQPDGHTRWQWKD